MVEAILTVQAALAALAPPGVLVAARLIVQGDEAALLSGERPDLAGARVERRRQSGAARDLARGLVEQLRGVRPALPRGPGGGPVWPEGLVGALAHDLEVAVAAVAEAGRFGGLGIDAEPDTPLPARLAAKIMTPTEIERAGSAGPAELRLHFAVKEAVYKATHPGDGLFLGFQDLELELAAGIARTRTGLTLEVAATRSPRILALAWIAR